MLVFPLVTVGRLTAQRFAHLRPDWDGRRDAFSDLFALPLSHRSDHGVEKAAGRTRCVDRLCERDKVSVVLAEKLRKFQKLFCVSRESGKF